MKQLCQMLQKTAVHFAKNGPAIYHSHHDMIRFWERAIKRAELPMRMTQGFNPRPRIIFPHALGLGIASMHEEVELELCVVLDKNHILQQIKFAAGDTLGIIDAVNLPPVKKSRQLVASTYRIWGWPDSVAARLGSVAQAIVEYPEIIVERGAPGKKRSLNVKPFLHTLVAAQDNGKPVLDLGLIHNTSGSARPDEIASLAASLLDVDKYSLSITKTGMTLE